MKMGIVAVVLGGALALGACSKPADTAAANSSNVSAEAGLNDSDLNLAGDNLGDAAGNAADLGTGNSANAL